MKKDARQPKQKLTSQLVTPKPFAPQSRFGGASGGTVMQKSQYKPSPVRITQHKG